MKTPLQQLMEYMEQNQYFIGNDLLAKYKELIKEEKNNSKDLVNINNSFELLKKFKIYYDKVDGNIKMTDSHDERIVRDFLTDEINKLQ